MQSPCVNWLSIVGFQFENVVINNKVQLFRVLGISGEEIVAASPFFQTETRQQKSCQIDFLIQTRFNVLYVCEIKFLSHPITNQVIPEMEEKLQHLRVPKNFSVRPVLIHVNGVAGSIREEGFFAEIIDFGALLEGEQA
jgi:hypothetical protein